MELSTGRSARTRRQTDASISQPTTAGSETTGRRSDRRGISSRGYYSQPVVSTDRDREESGRRRSESSRQRTGTRRREEEEDRQEDDSQQSTSSRRERRPIRRSDNTCSLLSLIAGSTRGRNTGDLEREVDGDESKDGGNEEIRPTSSVILRETRSSRIDQSETLNHNQNIIRTPQPPIQHQIAPNSTGLTPTDPANNIVLPRLNEPIDEVPGVNNVVISIDGTQYDGRTKIIDIPLNHIGVFSILLNSNTDLDAKWYQQVLLAYCSVMDRVLADPNDEVSWRKFLYLPLILFTRKESSYVKGVFKKINRDEWDSFRIAHYYQGAQTRNITTQGGDNEEMVEGEVLPCDKQREKAVSRLIENGDIRGASRKLQATVGETNLSMEQKVQKLKDKLPDETETHGELRGRHQQEFSSFIARMERENGTMMGLANVDNNQAQQRPIQVEELRDVIQKGRKTAAPGPDKLTYKHLSMLMPRHYEPPNERQMMFMEKLAKILTIIWSGSEPSAVSAAFTTYKLIALPKGNEDIRPIGLNILYRKILSAILVKRFNRQEMELKSFEDDDSESSQQSTQSTTTTNAEDSNKPVFTNYQYAFVKKGMERIVHTFHMYGDRGIDNSLDRVTLDADNAFSRNNNRLALAQCMLRFPEAVPFLYKMYLVNSGKGCVVGSDRKSIEVVNSPKNGIQQGDAAGTWAFCLTQQPMLEAIGDWLKQKFYETPHGLMFYVDDANMFGPTEAMRAAIEKIQDVGPLSGYNIKVNKGTYLLGKKSSYEEASESKLIIMQTMGEGFEDSFVKIHPENELERLKQGIGTGEVLLENELPERLQQEWELIKKQYGMKVLGSFVGTDEYIKAQLELELERLQKDAEAIISLSSLQERYVLLTTSFNLMPLHFFRTIPHSLLTSFIDGFMVLQQKIVWSLLNDSRAVHSEFARQEMEETFNREELWKLMALPIEQGGLGMLSLHIVAKMSYLASITANVKLIPYLSRIMGEVEEAYLEVDREMLEKYQIEQRQFDEIQAIRNRYEERLLGCGIVNETKQYVQEHFGANEDWVGIIQFDDIIKHIQSNFVETLDKGTIQHQLVELIVTKTAEMTFSSMPKRTLKIWYSSLRNEEAGMWLKAIPKFKLLKFTNEQFFHMLRFRYFLKIPSIGEGTRCNCFRSNSNVACRVDTRGHHFAHGCAKNNVYTPVHDALNIIFGNNLVNYSGLDNKFEPVRQLTTAEDSSEKRPDGMFTFYVSAIRSVTVAYDITLVSSLKVNNEGMVSSKGSVGKAANDAYQEKMRKYGALCEARGIRFVPIVMETSGYIHEKSKKLINKLASIGSNTRKIGQTVLYKYFLKLLNSCMMRYMADNIVRLSRQSRSNALPLSIEEMNEVNETIANHDTIITGVDLRE